MAIAPHRVLVVEDDPEMAGQMADSLSANGYEVDSAFDGMDGLERGRSGDYAVMTIDRMLPNMDGIAIIQNLRAEGIATPALIVSALGEIDDRCADFGPVAMTTLSSRLHLLKCSRG